MLILHGFAFSNYHNIVKHTLLYKGVPFEDRLVYPNTPEMMAVNPTGKAPAMTTEQGTCLSESSVLVDYLEDAYPERPLYPQDPEARARVRQIMKVSELYLELPARRMLSIAFFDAPPSEQLNEEVRAVLDRGTRSLNALASFSPYVTGQEMTLADIYLRYALMIPRMVGPQFLDWDVNTQVEGLSAWWQLMADSDIARTVDADLKANEPEFKAYLAKR